MLAHLFVPVLFFSGGCGSKTPSTSNLPQDPASLASAGIKPIDSRHRILAAEFEKTTEGQWVSPVVEAAFPFDELIYSWHLRLATEGAFRLYLKVAFAPGDETSWLYAGFWGDVKDPVSKREKPTFDRGIVDMDWLKLKAKAASFQFKVVDSGTKPLDAPPSLTVVATDNHPTPDLYAHFRAAYTGAPPSGRVFDIPLRRQIDSQGNPMADRCQSAALASAMEYYGRAVALEDIVRYTHDPEYNYPGLWPRVIGAAGEFGFAGYVDRFRDWSAVRNALAEDKIILCSIRMREGECKAPPYAKIGNHIVALNGVTDDGRVVVTDSALGRSGQGYLCQWLQEDFEKIWMQTKGGVAMVICPPAGMHPRVVTQLASFPTQRPTPTGDDH